MKVKQLFSYVFFIIGTVIGAGILSLPIIYKDLGWFSLILIFISFLFTILASIIFVKVYYKPALDLFKGYLKIIAYASIFISGFSALIAYTIGISKLINSDLGLIIIPLILFFISFFELKREMNIDALFSVILFTILISLLFCLGFSADVSKLNRFEFNFHNAFLALSVTMFAFSGYFSLTEVYKFEKKNYFKIILIAFGLVAMLYSAYTIFALANGIQDLAYNKDRNLLYYLTHLFAFFSMFTSAMGVFVGLKTHLKWKYESHIIPLLLLLISYLFLRLNISFEQTLSFGSRFGLSVFVGFLPMIYIFMNKKKLKNRITNLDALLSVFVSIFFLLLVFFS